MPCRAEYIEVLVEELRSSEHLDRFRCLNSDGMRALRVLARCILEEWPWMKRYTYEAFREPCLDGALGKLLRVVEDALRRANPL